MSPSSKDQATPPPPGAPAAASVPLEEPTEPHDPLPPKPEQQAPATVSPTGADLGAPSTAMSQQGAFLTTSTGARLRDTDHSLRAGSRGPTLLQDHHLREKITHFDHERIPERVVHARGAGAHGVFVGYGAASDLTSAAFLEQGRRDTGVRAVLDRRRLARLGRHGARHPWVRGEVLHRARATSTSSATTSRCSSSRTASSSPTSSTR